MSKFRVEVPKDLRASPEERAAPAIALKMSLGKKVHKLIKDEVTLREYYTMVIKLKGRPVYYLDFEQDYELGDIDELVYIKLPSITDLKNAIKIVPVKLKKILRKRQ